MSMPGGVMAVAGEQPGAVRVPAGTRQVNVRFDEATRESLETLAAETDRKLSQLVRYAVAWWFAAGCPEGPDGTGEMRGRYVNVRFEEPVIADLTAAGARLGLGEERSAVIRVAVGAWLERVQPVPDLLGKRLVLSAPVAAPRLAVM